MSNLNLKWTSHLELLASLDQLLQDKNFVDVTLAVEGQLLQAHKVILCASSPYFSSILYSNLTPHPVIFMRDVKFVEMKAILDFIYKGEVCINEEYLSGLLKTSKALKVTGLCNISWSESMSNNEGNESSNFGKDDTHLVCINPIKDEQSSAAMDTTDSHQTRDCMELIQLTKTVSTDKILSNDTESKEKVSYTITQQDMAELIQQDCGDSSGVTSDDDGTVIVLEIPPEVSITPEPSSRKLQNFPGRQYSKDDLQQALEMVRKGQMGIKPAARAYNIPVATLHHAARRNKIASPLQQGGNHMPYKSWKMSKEKSASVSAWCPLD